MSVYFPDHLSLEEKIVLLCSRIELLSEDKTLLRDLLLKGPNWGIVLKLSIFNKVVGLVSRHIMSFNTEILPGLVLRQLSFLYLGNKLRNEALQDEIRKVVTQLNDACLQYALLKGAYMIPAIYRDYGLRLSNDIDILIYSRDTDKFCSAFEKCGYAMGVYDDPTHSIIPAKRSEDLMWKMKRGNIHPYIKLSDNPYLHFVAIDMSFDIDPYEKNTCSSQKILENTTEFNMNGVTAAIPSAMDFLIQVCTHLYKESRTVDAGDIFSRLNLIKFCDVRELMRAYTAQHLIKQDDLNSRAAELGVLNALHYCNSCVKSIYGEEYLHLPVLADGTEKSTDNAILPNCTEFFDIMFLRKPRREG